MESKRRARVRLRVRIRVPNAEGNLFNEPRKGIEVGSVLDEHKVYNGLKDCLRRV